LNTGVRGIEKDLPDLLADRRSARFNRFNHLFATIAQPAPQHAELRGLATTVYAFESDEPAALHRGNSDFRKPSPLGDGGLEGELILSELTVIIWFTQKVG
jgi:hypothetical protein